MERTNTVIVGAGPAGLATAASLQRRGIRAVVLEKAETVAPAWHSHYDRLHLHTNKEASGLPHRPMPRSFPRYPSRDDVARYLIDYASEEGLDIRVGKEVRECTRTEEGWLVTITGNDQVNCRSLVVATGLSHTPYMPSYPGMDRYRGQVLHSAHYRNGRRFIDRDVLVVGFGNSAGEIALDLIEHGARPSISVRSPSVVVPRDILGIPILTIARWLSIFPPKLGDWLSRPLLALLVGDISRVGIPKADWGPLEQIATTGRIPLLDIGTMAALKVGSLVARPGIAEFSEAGVVFTDGVSQYFDAVVFGTGYVAAVDEVLTRVADLVDDEGRPLVSGGDTGVDGLYFCGFREPPTGRLREIGVEAERIGDLIAARVG